MDRIDGPTTVDIGGGRRGFRGKDTVAGVPGTSVRAKWLNALQEEAIAIIEKTGQIPNGEKTNQILLGLRSQFLNFVPVVGGTANALTAALDPVLTDHVPGLPVRLIVTTTNTGPATFNLGPGALPIRTVTGAALAGGELPVGCMIELICTGTAWVLTGLTTIAPRQLLTYTAPGTQSLIIPAGIFWARAKVQAGGAGGGGSFNAYSGATGGGGGGYGEGLYKVTPGDSKAVTVGAGGAAGTAGGGNGGPGGSSSFGSHVAASGGSPGSGASSGTPGAFELRQDAGAGGIPSGGAQFGRNGSYGNGTYAVAGGGLIIGGVGGAAYGGTGSRITVNGPGGAGQFPGDGGGGASANANGGVGRDGLVTIELF